MAPSELEQVEAALRESELDISAFQYVERIKSLNSSSTASRGNIVDWAEKLYGQSIGAGEESLVGWEAACLD